MELLIACLLLAAVVLVMMVVGRTNATPPSQPATVEFSDEPDLPLVFGRKSMWIAARAPNAEALAETLGLTEQRTANWHTGFLAAFTYPSDFVFVTPPIEGWVMAVGIGLFDPGDPDGLPRFRGLMEAVSSTFGEAQYFGSHRASGYSAWARYFDGSERRLFAYADDLMILDVGAPFPEEADLIRHLPDPDAAADDPDYWERTDLRTPDEEDVLRIAAAWSIDPSTLDSLSLPPSVGIAGRLQLSASE